MEAAPPRVRHDANGDPVYDTPPSSARAAAASAAAPFAAHDTTGGSSTQQGQHTAGAGGAGQTGTDDAEVPLNAFGRRLQPLVDVLVAPLEPRWAWYCFGAACAVWPKGPLSGVGWPVLWLWSALVWLLASALQICLTLGLSLAWSSLGRGEEALWKRVPWSRALCEDMTAAEKTPSADDPSGWNNADYRIHCMLFYGVVLGSARARSHSDGKATAHVTGGALRRWFGPIALPDAIAMSGQKLGFLVASPGLYCAWRLVAVALSYSASLLSWWSAVYALAFVGLLASLVFCGCFCFNALSEAAEEGGLRVPLKTEG